MRKQLVVWAVVLVAMMQPAVAGNPLAAFVRKAKSAGRAVGSFIGAPFGGLVEALAQPTLDTATDRVERVVQDVDVALGHNIDRAGALVDQTTTKVDAIATARIDQIDRSLQARITQVTGSLDDTVGRAFDRVDDVIGRLDAVARKRIAQIAANAQKLLAAAVKDASALLAQADAILANRIGDLRGVISGAITQADQVAQARIEQLDEAAGRRIGNLDVIATKQTIAAEQVLLRLAALVAFVAFIAFVLWRLFVEVGTGWTAFAKAVKDDISVVTHLGGTAKLSLPRLVPQLAFAGLGAYVLWVMSGRLPRDARARATQQLAAERTAFTEARDALDVPGVRYHEAQLQILDPDHAGATRIAREKVELLDGIFTRPGKLQTTAGISAAMQDIARIEDEEKHAFDPDVLTVKAFVLWQATDARKDELEAGLLCADALLSPSADPFVLAALANHYVTLALDEGAGPTAEQTARLQAAAKVAVPATASQRFAATIAYDNAVRALQLAALPRYAEMVDAEAQLLHHTAPDAREKRNAAAEAIVEAWRVFDDALASPTLAGSTVTLAAFTLDDAVLSHALYYVTHPTVDTLPPAIATADPATRLQMAPLRVALEKQLAPLIGPSAQEVLAYEESKRFEAYELRALAYERAYVSATRVATVKTREEISRDGSAAARIAAEMGMFAVGKGIQKTLEANGGVLDEDAQAAIQASTARRSVLLL